jgi:4-hydroxyproline epimerase
MALALARGAGLSEPQFKPRMRCISSGERSMERLRIVDSHTAGEPTRVIVAGGPDLGGGAVAARCELLRREFDRYRRAVVTEPRGSDVVVGALLVPPEDAACATGVVFFNNAGYLGMCGHGTIGVIATLAHLGRIGPGEHRIETPVGMVLAVLHDSGEVSVTNVPSWRARKDVTVEVAGLGPVTGDVAYGGNWFYLVAHQDPALALEHAGKLTELCGRIRQAVNQQGFPEIDHIELFGPPASAAAHARNFVLCPGAAYDRSPCGTGTSAKLACLAADGKLAEDTPWVQESIMGSRFVGRYRWLDRASGKVVPTIRGRAFVNAEATHLLDDSDPFCWGIP